MQELKDRAFRHIVKSLTVENVAIEAFSAFSAAFEDVRKVRIVFFITTCYQAPLIRVLQVQITFMFQNWMAVRTGALANIGQLLRIGKLPGFEEGEWNSAYLGHDWAQVLTAYCSMSTVWPMILQNLVAEDKKADPPT